MTIIIKNVLYVLITLFITLFAVSCNNDDDHSTPIPTPTETQMTVLGYGNAVVKPKSIIHSQTGEILEAGCFLMDLVDPITGGVIGTLEDCVVNDVDNGDGTITSRVITTINITGRGSITAENQVLQTPSDIEGIFITIFTPSEDNIIDATHEFEGATGTVSLIGAVDLVSFDIGIVMFNCSFTINMVSIQ